jgi:dethiobiotin synthetase
MAKILFITGTDTGVGKTVLTALLVRHLREAGCEARAMKPFCSGSRADARLLRAAQENALALDEINPFYIEEPVAPAAAAGRGKNISLDSVLRKISAVSSSCDVLLIEGSGGLLVPLGKNYTVADLIGALRCPVVVVSRTRLGTINHTSLTVNALQSSEVKDIKIVLMEEKKPDFSTKSNLKMIQKMAPKTPVFVVQNLGLGASKSADIKINVKFMKKTLARILGDDIFVLVRRGIRKNKLFNKTR